MKNPIFELLALSPERAWTILPRGALSVGPNEHKSRGFEVSYDGRTTGYNAVFLGAGISVIFWFTNTRCSTAERGIVAGNISIKGLGSIVRKSRFM
jgi:hypothetical protein